MVERGARERRVVKEVARPRRRKTARREVMEFIWAEEVSIDRGGGR